jgi:hypothetical protein
MAVRYLQLLPIPDLPTLWTENELSLFKGTTLIPAVRAKVKKLRSEFKALKQCTKSVKWLSDMWWGASSKTDSELDEIMRQLGAPPEGKKDDEDDELDDPHSLIKFDDWLMLDAMFRSRAMEWPGEGDAMVPILDLVNHDVPANAEYEVDSDGGGLLYVSKGMDLARGEEILISYGDKKSALEVLFSYGFWPHYECSTEILLPLPNPEDDPLGPAKVALVHTSKSVPGIRIYMDHHDGIINWDSEALWLMVVNEEDGLDFKVAYGEDNERELHMTWKDEVVEFSNFKEVLQKDDRWDLFDLRATLIVREQVAAQLAGHPDTVQVSHSFEDFQSNPRLQRLRSAGNDLRATEFLILSQAEEVLKNKVRCMDSYLSISFSLDYRRQNCHSLLLSKTIS